MSSGGGFPKMIKASYRENTKTGIGLLRREGRNKYPEANVFQ
ncbi:MAG: hypothetical protein ACI8YQ_001943 [Polaribacter sp.]|jgi:hypothetical protein